MKIEVDRLRTLAVGDIHGSFRALQTLAKFVPFQSDDLLVTLGDYVDRGPDTCSVLDWLIDWQRKHRLVALRGNHESMMMHARRGGTSLAIWLGHGGREALASYSPFGDKGKLVDVPNSHWDFIERTVLWHETETHFFVHANAAPNSDLEDQSEAILLWDSFEETDPHISGKTMVCGHTRQQSGEPFSMGHAVCIDTGAGFDGGWLTCLDVESKRYWQADDRGRTREGTLWP